MRAIAVLGDEELAYMVNVCGLSDLTCCQSETIATLSVLNAVTLPRAGVVVGEPSKCAKSGALKSCSKDPLKAVQ